MKRFLAISMTLAAMLILMVAAPVAAQTTESGDNVIIEAGETIDDDLFIGGNKVKIDGTVNGDVFVGATEVVINGTVNGNVFGGGSIVTINGEINGSVFIGGQLINVGESAAIAGSFYGGGNSLEFADGSEVARSIFGGGFQVLLDGDVGRDVNAGGMGVALNGNIGGDANLGVGSESDAEEFDPQQMEEWMKRFNPNMPDIDIDYIAPGLTIGSNATIGGDLNYESEAEQSLDGLDVGGSVNYTEAVAANGSEPVEVSVQTRIWSAVTERIGEFIALAIVGSLLLWLIPSVPNKVSTIMRQKFLPSTGWGALSFVVFLFAIPVAIGVLILVSMLAGLISFGQLSGTVFSFGGLSIFGLIVLFSFVAFSLSKIAAAYLVGSELFARQDRNLMEGANRYIALLIGLLIYQIIRAIPFVGWAVSIFVILAGIGACIIWLRNRNQGLTANAA